LLGVGRYDPQVSDGAQHLWMSRPLLAGAFPFLVASTDLAVKDQVEALFRDLPSPDDSERTIDCFMLVPAGSGEAGRWDLTGPIVGSSADLTLAAGVTFIMTGVNLAALGAEPERLHLHAGAAVRGGRAVVLSAPREAGKTTTLARMALRGWGFISDEAVSIAPGDDQLRGFAKPLSVKPRGRQVLRELEPHMVPPVDDAGDDEVLHVPLGAIGALAHPSAEPHVVVFLRRFPDGDPAARPSGSVEVHPADAVVALMGETMDAGRFGPGAVIELAHLAARCHSYEVVVADAEETVELIERLFDAPAATPVAVQVLEAGERIRPHALSVLVGDHVVIHEQPAGRILALDQVASQVWLALGGRPTTQDIDLDGPVVAPFVANLVALDLVAPVANAADDGR
jgi:hypothetical protein